MDNGFALVPSTARPSAPELRARARLLASGGALARRAACRTGAALPLHHPAGHRRRTAQTQSCRPSRAATDKGGTSHIVMEPLEFMELLVSRPRLHLIRFHGVLASNAELRSKIVPAPAERTPRRQARTLTRRARRSA